MQQKRFSFLLPAHRAFLLFLFALLFYDGTAIAATHFPALTDRVVDEAHVFSAHTIAVLDEQLAREERATSNQLVVVTLASLQGVSIEDYGYQLGRFWGIGQKGKNNGVILILAPKEHKIRIEVGYGLEGVITDAVSSQIINGIILPRIRAGDITGGLSQGVQAIINTLHNKPAATPLDSSATNAQTISQNAPESGVQLFISVVLLLLFLVFVIRHPFIAFMLLSNTSRFGSSSSGGSGWSGGGGGSFGGGGASGSW